MSECIFCQLKENKNAILAENESFYLIKDKFPITKGHSLIISKRHAATIFDLKKSEASDLLDLIQQAKKKLDAEFEPDGYNINSNNGADAGQIIFHCHVHVVPRYADRKKESFKEKNGVYDKLAKPIQKNEQP